MNIKMTIGGKPTTTKMLSINEYLSIVNSSDKDEAVLEVIQRRFGDLPKHLAEQAFIKLVAMSKNKKIKMATECTCGVKHKFELPVDNILVTDNTDLTYKVGSVIINMRHPMMFEDRDVFELIDRCIVNFEHEGQIYDWLTCSENEKDIIFRMMNSNDIVSMADKLRSNKVYAGAPISCECGNNWAAVIEGPKAILEALGV